jgi:putative membrane protein
MKQQTLKESSIFALEYFNLLFVVPLGLGILLSLVTFARVVSYLMVHAPLQLWAFFFGLIAASIFTMTKQLYIKAWSTYVFGSLGVSIGYWVTVLYPIHVDSSSLFSYYWCSFIAICAMILPGISGSFILLLMGMYLPVIEAIRQFDIVRLATVCAGCASGIIAFSYVLSFLLKRFRAAMLALLTGFMLGSLNKVWPWKVVLQSTIDSHGNSVAIVEQSVSPAQFSLVTGRSDEFIVVCSLMILGAVAMCVFDHFASKQGA